MTFRKIARMADDRSWFGLDYWQRVQWARRRWQKEKGSVGETARAAAESLGMKEDTYSAYERRPDSSKHTKLNDQAAIRFARKFGVRWEWLLTGQGEPWLTDDPQVEEGRQLLAQVPKERRAEMIQILKVLSGR